MFLYATSLEAQCKSQLDGGRLFHSLRAYRTRIANRPPAHLTNRTSILNVCKIDTRLKWERSNCLEGLMREEKGGIVVIGESHTGLTKGPIHQVNCTITVAMAVIGCYSGWSPPSLGPILSKANLVIGRITSLGEHMGSYVGSYVKVRHWEPYRVTPLGRARAGFWPRTWLPSMYCNWMITLGP